MTATPDRSNKLHATQAGLPALLTIAQVADATGFAQKTITTSLRRWHLALASDRAALHQD